MIGVIVKLSVTLAAIVLTSGCATTSDAPPHNRKAMITAAEFESMIKVEVRELEPLDVDGAVAAAY